LIITERFFSVVQNKPRTSKRQNQTVALKTNVSSDGSPK
jgi:hypothetical protein